MMPLWTASKSRGRAMEGIYSSPTSDYSKLGSKLVLICYYRYLGMILLVGGWSDVPDCGVSLALRQILKMG